MTDFQLEQKSLDWTAKQLLKNMTFTRRDNVVDVKSLFY